MRFNVPFSLTLLSICSGITAQYSNNYDDDNFELLLARDNYLAAHEYYLYARDLYEMDSQIDLWAREIAKEKAKAQEAAIKPAQAAKAEAARVGADVTQAKTQPPGSSGSVVSGHKTGESSISKTAGSKPGDNKPINKVKGCKQSNGEPCGFKGIRKERLKPKPGDKSNPNSKGKSKVLDDKTTGSSKDKIKKNIKASDTTKTRPSAGSNTSGKTGDGKTTDNKSTGVTKNKPDKNIKAPTSYKTRPSAGSATDIKSGDVKVVDGKATGGTKDKLDKINMAPPTDKTRPDTVATSKNKTPKEKTDQHDNKKINVIKPSHIKPSTGAISASTSKTTDGKNVHGGGHNRHRINKAPDLHKERYRKGSATISKTGGNKTGDNKNGGGIKKGHVSGANKVGSSSQKPPVTTGATTGKTSTNNAGCQCK